MTSRQEFASWKSTAHLASVLALAINLASAESTRLQIAVALAALPTTSSNAPEGKPGRSAGCGLLKSTSGKPEGPCQYMQPAQRLGDEIDASLFQDDDGEVYSRWHCGKIARMKPDMSGLAEPYRWLKTATSDLNPKHHSGLCKNIFGRDSFDHVGFEGAFLFKANGPYYPSCAEYSEGRYSCAIATSTNLFGPYGERYEALSHAGHNVFFKNSRGQWWSTVFGTDDLAPWRERASILPIPFEAAGKVALLLSNDGHPDE